MPEISLKQNLKYWTKELAKPLEKAKVNQSDQVLFLDMQLGNESYCLDAKSIEEIIEIPEIVLVPETPTAICGIINHRNQIITVVDLKKLMGFPADVSDAENKNSAIVIVKTSDAVTGLLSSSISDMVGLDLKTFQPPIETIRGIERNYIKGIKTFKDKLLILMNLDTMLASVQNK